MILKGRDKDGRMIWEKRFRTDERIIKKLRRLPTPMTDSLLSELDAIIGMAQELREHLEAMKEHERDYKIAKQDAELYNLELDRRLLKTVHEAAVELSWKEDDLIEFLLEKKFLYLDEDNRLQPTPFQVKDGTFATEKDGGVEQVLVTPVGIESLRLQKKLWDKRRRRDE